MKQDLLFSKLQEYGLHTRQAFLAEAFSRNIGLLTQAEQQELSKAKVAIPGMGGVGGVHLITLSRTGIGKFHLADFDTYEPANINRQFGAKVPHLGRPKVEVMVEQALSINPYLEITTFPEGINAVNMDDFLDGVQVVLDGLDFFAFDTRRSLFNRAREKGIYVITAGPMGFSAAMLIFSPHVGMGFDEYFHLIEGMSTPDKHLAFGLGLAPRATHIKYMDLSKVDFEAKAGPSLHIACQICSGMAATEVVRIILNKRGIKPVPYYFQFDPYLQKYRKGKLYLGNRNPLQQVKMRIVKMMLRKKKAQYKVSPPQFPQVSVTADHLPEEIMHYMLQAGIQAPSGDNAQPWKFAYQGNTVFLYLDRNADRSFFNFKQFASIISCGAVLENIRVAATAFGLQAKSVYLPSADDKDLMASVEFVPDAVPKDPLSNAIWKRLTNRKFYAQKPVPQSTFHDLTKCIAEFPGTTLHIITETSDLKKLAKIIYKTDRIRTEHRLLHEHLHSMIRYSDQEVKEKRDGFPLKNLEAGMAGEVFLKSTRPWWMMNMLNTIGLGRLVALHSYQAIHHASVAALLTVQGMEPEDFLRGGQALERIWLTLTHKGLAMQPMTAVTLFWLRWYLEGDKNFAPKHRRLLQSIWAGYQELFPKVNFTDEGHVMLFRMGYGEEIRCCTLRKSLESFLA